MARNADGLILIVDLSNDPVGQLSVILNELEKSRIIVLTPLGRVEIERKFSGSRLRIILPGKLVDCTLRDVERLLESYRVKDAVVKISGEVKLDDVENSIFESIVYKPAIIVANKADAHSAEINLRQLAAYVDGRLPIVTVSCEKRYGLERLGEALLKSLDIIRVYTKEPSTKGHSENPFILNEGATVYDLVKSIHSDFSERFAFAKIRAQRLVFSPQKVGLKFTLEDGDVVEVHTR